MDEFEGSRKHYEHLRKCLKSLSQLGVGSQAIIDASNAPINRSTLDRFRGDKTDSIREARAVRRIWAYIQSEHKGVYDQPESYSAALPVSELANSAIQGFYDSKTYRSEKFFSKFSGTYDCYSLSSKFYHRDCFILSRLVIDRDSKTSPTHIVETQNYSGHLGLTAASETFRGFCVSKSGSEFFVSRETKQNLPKLYFLQRRQINAYDNKVDYFEGFFVDHSLHFGGYFRSQFICVRVTEGEGKPLDIFDKSDLTDPSIRLALYGET